MILPEMQLFAKQRFNEELAVEIINFHRQLIR